ncbi:MAG TPA: homocysteine S-methyltransferase family protein, partial [Tepiditoga sp.]|nr:homocysteine S-methyltransferase family protein [Tepiditoga sp.]
MKNPDLIYKIHKSYADAGTDFITTNTFGANRYKLFKSGFSPDDIISNAIKIAKKASSGQKIALDIGPIGKLMEPSGPLNFEEAYDIFKEEVISGVKNGADLIIIETISDIYEAKAAILAAKENSELPVICTMTFDSDGRTFTGTDIITMVNVIENLNVDALGVNCSLGPKEMLPNVKKILEYSSLPVIVQPNAGLPKMREGKTFYDITPCEFSKYVTEMIDYGVKIVGGCCGTDENYIKELKKNIKDLTPKKITVKSKTLVSSYSRTVDFDSGTVLIGERINPTGKKLLKAALKEENYDYIVTQAIKQHEEGAVILDVNNGMPGINEEISLVTSVKEIQKITDIPLQIDSSDINAIEKAVRIYNGKPIVNSVNGKKNNMEKIFPIVKKHGCCVIGLTLDEDG